MAFDKRTSARHPFNAFVVWRPLWRAGCGPRRIDDTGYPQYFPACTVTCCPHDSASCGQSLRDSTTQTSSRRGDILTTCPKWPPHELHMISTRRIPWDESTSVTTDPLKHLSNAGHPQPLAHNQRRSNHSAKAKRSGCSVPRVCWGVYEKIRGRTNSQRII